MARKRGTNRTEIAQSKYALETIICKLNHGDGCFTMGILKGKPCLRYYQYFNGWHCFENKI